MEYKEIREVQLELFSEAKEETRGGGRSNVQPAAPAAPTG